jgi:hypothetical protein
MAAVVRIAHLAQAGRAAPRAALVSMRNWTSPIGAVARLSTRSMRAAAGAAAGTLARNCETASASPSTSIQTPRGSLRTKPPSDRPAARWCIAGRNPTPWTVPSIRISRRARPMG